MSAQVQRVVDCPECHQYCGWCAWYRKNAREVGCGLRVPSGLGKASKRRCEWGEQAKGVPCGTCDGSGEVLATITYARIKATGVEPHSVVDAVDPVAEA